MERKSEDENNNVIGKQIEVKIAIWIATTILAIVSTWMATRSGLDSRLGVIEAYMESQRPIDDELKRIPLYEQINSLALIENELTNLRLQLERLPSLKFDYGDFTKIPGINPKTINPDLPKPLVVIKTQEKDSQPISVALEAQQLQSVSFSEPIRSLNDADLVSDIYETGLLLNRYNFAFNQSGIYYPYQNWVPRSSFTPMAIGIGATKTSVENWEKMSNEIVLSLRTRLNGSLIDRVSKKRKSLEQLLE